MSRRTLSRERLRRAVVPLVKDGRWDERVFEKWYSMLSKSYSDADSISTSLAGSVAYEMNDELPF